MAFFISHPKNTTKRFKLKQVYNWEYPKFLSHFGKIVNCVKLIFILYTFDHELNKHFGTNFVINSKHKKIIMFSNVITILWFVDAKPHNLVWNHWMLMICQLTIIRFNYFFFLVSGLETGHFKLYLWWCDWEGGAVQDWHNKDNEFVNYQNQNM